MCPDRVKNSNWCFRATTLRTSERNDTTDFKEETHHDETPVGAVVEQELDDYKMVARPNRDEIGWKVRRTTELMMGFCNKHEVVTSFH